MTTELEEAKAEAMAALAGTKAGSSWRKISDKALRALLSAVDGDGPTQEQIRDAGMSVRPADLMKPLRATDAENEAETEGFFAGRDEAVAAIMELFVPREDASPSPLVLGGVLDHRHRACRGRGRMAGARQVTRTKKAPSP